uniref:Ubiquitin-like domain-containing protein n=1 Tax=Lotharella oceanica TaxID=641309 RepID=A0A7S2XB92_9EUKA
MGNASSKKGKSARVCSGQNQAGKERASQANQVDPSLERSNHSPDESKPSQDGHQRMGEQIAAEFPALGSHPDYEYLIKHPECHAKLAGLLRSYRLKLLPDALDRWESGQRGESDSPLPYRGDGRQRTRTNRPLDSPFSSKVIDHPSSEHTVMDKKRGFPPGSPMQITMSPKLSRAMDSGTDSPSAHPKAPALFKETSELRPAEQRNDLLLSPAIPNWTPRVTVGDRIAHRGNRRSGTIPTVPNPSPRVMASSPNPMIPATPANARDRWRLGDKDPKVGKTVCRLRIEDMAKGSEKSPTSVTVRTTPPLKQPESEIKFQPKSKTVATTATSGNSNLESPAAKEEEPAANHSSSTLSGPLNAMSIKQIFAPKICQDKNNWVSRDTIWQCPLVVINVENGDVEEMAVRSNHKVGDIKKAYLDQSGNSKNTKFLYCNAKSTLVELDDEKELREYRIGDGDPVYASNSIYITLCNKYIVA